MVLSGMKRIFILCVVFCAGCDFPPAEAAKIRQQLQAQISKEQVYVTHSSDELSYMMKNSEFTRRPETEKAKIVGIVEKDALELLAKYRNYKYIRKYFLGEGRAGIDKPYICQTASEACRTEKDEVNRNRHWQTNLADAGRPTRSVRHFAG